MVAALDNERAGTASAFVNREVAAAAVAESARRGYVDGRALDGVFTWLRPNDLVWNYVVNNYLLGKQPPAFDVLYWNQDTRAAGRRPAPRLHPARARELARAARRARGARHAGRPRRGRRSTATSSPARPTTSSRGRTPTAARSCSAATSRFVLSTCGHIQALVNPPAAEAARATASPTSTRADAEAWARAGRHAARQLVARLRRVAGRALGRARARTQGLGGERPRRGQGPGELRPCLSAMTTPCPTPTSARRSPPTTSASASSSPTSSGSTSSPRAASSTRRSCPAINDYWEAAELPWPLMRRLADLGLYGEDIEGYGCPGMSPLARGLVNMELHRGDGSLGTFLGVQSGLAMKSIALLGSEEQKERWLPAMARLDAIGAFALTEPAHGSDSRRARDDARAATATAGCSTAPSAGSATARSPTSSSSGRATVEDGQVKGFLVETDTPGFDGRDDRRQGRRARDLAGRRSRSTACASRRVGCPARTRSRTPAACSVDHARHVRVGRARPRRRRLRRGAHLQQAARPVRQAARAASRSSRSGS